MIHTFPSTLPQGYRVVYSTGVNLTRTVYDGTSDEPIGNYIGEPKALESAWRHYLNKLNYVGVATLLVSLQGDGITDLKQEVAAIRSAKSQKEARIAVLQRELLESEAREKATSDCAEAALQSWKNEANDAHQKVEELEAKVVALNATLKRIGTIAGAAKKLSDTLMGCIENPVTAKPAALVTEPPPSPAPQPVDPSFDFDGPMPEGMPTGYRVEHQGARKPLAYKVFGPGGLSISCFTQEAAHEKSWEHIRAINKAKVKEGAPAPKPAPPLVTKPTSEDRTKLPAGYTTRYVYTSKHPHQLTRPDGHNEYFQDHHAALQGAWVHFRNNQSTTPETKATTSPPSLPPGFKETFMGPSSHHPYKLTEPSGNCQFYKTPAELIEGAWKISKANHLKVGPVSTEAPPGYAFDWDSSKRFSWGLRIPGGFTIWFLSHQVRLKAAWKHHRAKPGDRMESIRGMNESPDSLENNVPDRYKKERNSAQHDPHKLTRSASSGHSDPQITQKPEAQPEAKPHNGNDDRSLSLLLI